MVRRHDVEAVLVPNIAHLDGVVPTELVSVCDVITVTPENTYARWAVLRPGSDPAVDDAQCDREGEQSISGA